MSGGFNPVSMISQVALAAVTGGTSLIAQIAMQIVSQIAKQVIQEVGQQLGLPQPVIDAAQGAFDMATGNSAGAAQEFQQAAGGLTGAVNNGAQALGLTPSQTGELQRGANDKVKDIAAEQMENYRQEALEGKDSDGNSNKAKKQAAQAGGSGESFLMKLAIALGTVIDNKMEEQLKLAKEIDGKKSSGDESTMSTDSAKLQALAQEISLMSNALTNSIKTVGEATTTLARKG